MKYRVVLALLMLLFIAAKDPTVYGFQFQPGDPYEYGFVKLQVGMADETRAFFRVDLIERWMPDGSYRLPGAYLQMPVQMDCWEQIAELKPRLGFGNKSQREGMDWTRIDVKSRHVSWRGETPERYEDIMNVFTSCVLPQVYANCADCTEMRK